MRRLRNLNRAGHPHTTPDPAGDDTGRLGRRRLIRGLTAGALGAVAVGRPTSVGAANGDPLVLGSGLNAAGESTVLTVSTTGSGLQLAQTGSGSAARFEGATGANEATVVSYSGGGGPGIQAYNTGNSGGNAVFAAITNPANVAAATYTYTLGTGPALWAENFNAASSNPAIGATNPGSGPTAQLFATGTGRAVSAVIYNGASRASSVYGRTLGSGPGIEGRSDQGTGGRFRGATAQINLVPNSAATHPSSGRAGDFFVDRAKRLWFCRGGSRWVQLV